jgi:hypothetical protein
MPTLKISIIESAYLIYMFLFFKTSIDFNIFDSPSGELFGHLVGSHYGLRICLFGRYAIFALIFVLIARHYINMPQWFLFLTFLVTFLLSFLNLNAVAYLIPVWIIEYLYQ